MKPIFVLDACALIAFFNDEQGADRVEDIIEKAMRKEYIIFMNKLNLLEICYGLEIYYGVYRDDGEVKAEGMLIRALSLPIKIVNKFNDDAFKEAGRLKAKYKISLADSIALAEAKTRKAQLITADHREFDPIDKDGEISFHWIR